MTTPSDDGIGASLRERDEQRVYAACFHNRYLGSPCLRQPVWVSAGLGNIVDGWTWCALHAPGPDFRRRLQTEGTQP